MTKITEGELLDLLPSGMKEDTDMICLSYALKMAVDRLRKYEIEAMTQNFIESLPERILDVMAVELRSPYYTQDMDIEVKREIIKNTLVWHTKAGTVSAVEEMIAVLFGEGEVVEWPDFTEGEKTPGTFDIITNATMTEDIVAFFMSVIKRVKNERSHLRRVLIERDINVEPRAGVGAITYPNTVITNNKTIEDDHIEIHGKTGSGGYTHPSLTIVNMKEIPDTHLGLHIKAGSGNITSPNLTITNHPRDATSEKQVELSATAGAITYPRTIIK